MVYFTTLPLILPGLAKVELTLAGNRRLGLPRHIQQHS